MEAITHLLPQSEIAAKSFTQYQLGHSGNVGSFENGLGHATHSITASARASYCCGADLLVPCTNAWISSRVRRPSLFASIALKIRS